MVGMKAKKDRVFAKKERLVGDFSFGQKTAAVFDDMLDRSVSFYAEMQRVIGEIAGEFAVKGSNLDDFGCSTCTTFLALDGVVPTGVRFVGLDSSAAMLQKARAKLRQYGFKRPYKLVCADLNRPVRVSNASVGVLALTLQFVRPLYRHRLIESIARGTRKDGCLILIEKVLSRDSTLNRFFIKYYYEFKKRHGYSQMEISQKREALENVLIPYRVEENRELLLKAEFSQCDVFFKWYNFCGMIAIK